MMKVQNEGGLLIALLASASALSFPSSAIAQPAAQPDLDAPPAGTAVVPETANVGGEANEPSNEIIVTATRRAQSLQDVPMSVDVATGEQIQRLNIFDAKDVQQLSPGLELTNTQGRNNTATLRGVTFDPDQGTGPAVDLYYNDIPIDAQTAFTAIYDIDQIEVLRGPQGALRGRTSPAGAITIRTRRPNLKETEGYIQATGTEDHAYNLQGAVSVPIISDKLAIRVSGLFDRNRLNQVFNVNRDERSRSRTESFRAALSWKPTDNFDAVFTYQYLKSRNRQFPQVIGPGNAPLATFFLPFPPFVGSDPRLSGPPADAEDRIAVSEGIFSFTNKTHLFNLAANWDLGGVTVAFVGGRQYSVLNQDFDTDSTNAVPGYAPLQLGRTTYPVTTGELRLLSNNEGGFFNWTASIFYSSQTGKAIVDTRADAFFLVAPPEFGLFLPIGVHVDIPIDTRTVAIAGSSRFQFTDKLRLEVAARVSDIEGVQTGTVTLDSPGFPAFGIPPFTTTSAAIPAELQKTNSLPLTGGATLTYEASRDLTLYAAYGRSFRAATAGVSVPLFISSDLIKTKSERSDAFEIGAKASFFDRRLSLNTAAFYQKFDGFVSRFPGIFFDQGICQGRDNCVPGSAPDGTTEGTFDINYNGDATVKGIEATLAGKPIDNWDFSVAASYVKARYDNARVPCNDFNGDGRPDAVGTPDITGPGNVSYCNTNGRLSDTPNFNLTANSELRLPLGGVEPFVRGLYVYRPSVFAERSNFDLPSRSLLNLYLGVRDTENVWEIYAFAKNVLNQQRITNISSGIGQLGTQAGTFFVSGYRTVNVTNPREFGLTGTFRF
jgi:iron complex outermembrane recepter protein